MLLWAIMTIMASAAAVIVSAPFLRRYDDRRLREAEALAVYRDQLAEVDREVAGGDIDQDQAAEAKAEIERRILTVGDESVMPASVAPPAHRNFAATGVAAVVVLGSIALYAINGRPELPSATPAARTNPALPEPPRSAMSAPQLQIPASTAAATTAAPAAVPQSVQALGTVDEMIDRLQQRLKAKPDDPEGWRMLGWSQFSMNRFTEAAAAYERAVALTPSRPGLKTSWAEAMIRSAQGQVTPQSLAIVKEALALDPADPRARFFHGLAQEQSGDASSALDVWIAVLKDAKPADDWAAELRERVLELARKLGRNVASELPNLPKQPAGGPFASAPVRQGAPIPESGGGDGRGPTAQDVQAAQAMPPAQRMAMIRGMVDGLAKRLEASPRDLDGWVKLMRSRLVLGERDAARGARDRALKAFSDTPAEQQRIRDAAKELGLE